MAAANQYLSEVFLPAHNAAFRDLVAGNAWRAFWAAPLAGHGLGSFDTVFKTAMTPATFPALWNIHAAENLYMQWLVEAGVIGAGTADQRMLKPNAALQDCGPLRVTARTCA